MRDVAVVRCVGKRRRNTAEASEIAAVPAGVGTGRGCETGAPRLVKQRRLKWPDIAAMFDFPPAIRKAI